MGKVQFIFSRSLLLVLIKFSFWRKTGHSVIIPWSFDIILNFPNFLTSYVLSRSATRSATRIYQFITNNQASFDLWRKENLAKHQKFSKYDYGCSYLKQSNLLFKQRKQEWILEFLTVSLNFLNFWQFLTFLKEWTSFVTLRERYRLNHQKSHTGIFQGDSLSVILFIFNFRLFQNPLLFALKTC